MRKKNPMLAGMEEKYERIYRGLFLRKMRMVLQLSQDAGMIAANEVFGMGPGRAERFAEAYLGAVGDMADLIANDQRDDMEFAYARAKVDQRIKAIVGPEKFQPWEVRYEEDVR